MDINFIQIGANIGDTHNDIIWKIVRQNKWNGIFVEPILSSFEKLVVNYADLTSSYFENIAITDYTGTVNIYSQTNSQYNSQQASLLPEHYKKRNDLKHTVNCMTLNDLVDKYNLTNIPFDLLQIDAEGHDGTILLTTDFNKVIPNKIRFEKIHITKQQLKDVVYHLESHKYIQIPDEYSDHVSRAESGFDMMFKKQI